MLIAIIVLFLMLSALFSGSEIAFVSANKLKIELRKNKYPRRGHVIANFYERPAEFLGTMLVGNNIALIVFTSLMDTVLLSLLFRGDYNVFLAFIVNTVIITIVVLIFGEFLPKTLFRLFADEILFTLAIPLRVLQLILWAPAWITTRLSNLFLRFFVKSSVDNADTAFTRLDLENFVRDSRAPETEEDIDKELFGKALNLKDVRVGEAMVPRPEIESIDVEASVAALADLFQETKLSRILVTEGDIDNVLGYVHHQQLLKQPADIRSLIMDVPFVPEVMPVIDLMNKLIKERLPLACVVDEFGGMAGLITLEDILEEIFGEIEDEYDQEEHVESQIDEHEFLFSGRLEIDYLNEKYGLHFPSGDYHTLSGYLVMTTETIPEQGAELHLDGYQFILELVSETKIELVRVVRREPPMER